MSTNKVSTEIYRAYISDTGETLAIGNFGRAYEAVNGTYAESKSMSREEQTSRREGKAYEKLFDLAEDYTNSSNVEDWFIQAVVMLQDNDGLDDRDESDRIYEAVDNAISVYTYDIMECATQDISLATIDSEYGRAGETAFQVLQGVIYETLINAVTEYREIIKEQTV